MIDKRVQRLMRGMIAETTALMDDLANGLAVHQWEQRFARVLAERHAAAFLAGAQTTTLTPEQRRMVAQLVGEQRTYLRGFADAVTSDGASPTNRARATLYSGAIKEAFSRGATWGWPLPAYPAQGTQCRTNCGCAWEIVELDGEGNADAYWKRGKNDSCQTCQERATQWSPVRIRAGVLETP